MAGTPKNPESETPKPIVSRATLPPAPTERPAASSSGIDYVALAAIVMLCVVSCVALFNHNSEPVLVAVGAVAGFVTRLYK